MTPLRYAARPWLAGWWAVVDLVTDRIIAEYPTRIEADKAAKVWNGVAR